MTMPADVGFLEAPVARCGSSSKKYAWSCTLRARISLAAKAAVRAGVLGSAVHGADIAPGMKRNRCRTAVGMTIEAVCSLSRPTLESEREQCTFDLGGREHRNAGAHPSADGQRRSRDKFAFQLQSAFVAQQRDDFQEVLANLLDCLALRVGTGNAGHASDEQACLEIPFDDGIQDHAGRIPWYPRSDS